MSGYIFDNQESLICLICQQPYTKPHILSCFHSFCLQCLHYQTNGAIVCPICSSVTQADGTGSFPCGDEVLNFLLGSHKEETTCCANCDLAQSPMYFCETCNQALCGGCKGLTHEARMFQSHQVILHAQRIKSQHMLCALHREPYILYSRQRNTMLCIHCFRDMPIEGRSFCVDIDSAYHEACDKLDRVVQICQLVNRSRSVDEAFIIREKLRLVNRGKQAMRERQASVQTAIINLQSLLGDIGTNTEHEKEAIEFLHANLVEKLCEKKCDLLSECDRQYEDKESVYKLSLTKHSALLPTLHTNLITSTAFSTTANKYEFLQLYHVLIKRLRAVTKPDQPLVLSHDSSISSDYKTHFARCLEAVLFPFNTKHTKLNPLSGGSSSSLSNTPYTRLDVSTSTTGSGQVMSFVPVAGRRSNGMGVTVRFIDSKSVFADHCVQFRERHSELLSRTEKLKGLVQEVHRDLTIRRVYAKCSLVSLCQTETDAIRTMLDEHSSQLHVQKVILQKHWEESLERISNEQELYQVQINDVERLKGECGRLLTIATQLSPFVMSINSVTERILPHLGEVCEGKNKGGQHRALMDVISMITPDSQQRVDAIQALQEERLQMTANRTNPLDGELIKQKSLLRAPCERLSRGQREARTRSLGAEVGVDGEGGEIRCLGHFESYKGVSRVDDGEVLLCSELGNDDETGNGVGRNMCAVIGSVNVCSENEKGKSEVVIEEVFGEIYSVDVCSERDRDEGGVKEEVCVEIYSVDVCSERDRDEGGVKEEVCGDVSFVREEVGLIDENAFGKIVGVCEEKADSG